jgi:integrase
MKVSVINPTPRNIRALKCPPGKKQCYERISKDLHLYVSVTPGGSKSFVYRRYVGGTYRELHLELKFASTLDDVMAREVIREAESKAAELHARINRGENPFDDALSAKQEPTLQDLFQTYFKEHLDKKRKRAKQTEQDFNNWFADWKNRRVSSITRKDVEKLHGKVKTERGARTANKAIALGRAMLNKARLWKMHSGENVFSSISMFPEKTRDRFLSPEEAGKIIQGLQALPDTYEDLKHFVMLSLLIGARKANLLSMSWNDIDLSAGIWTIPETKNGSSQLVPLGQTELDILTSRRDAQKDNSTISPYVFPSTRNSSSGHLIDPKKAWTTFRRNVGIKDITLHDLRRSLAATMAANNQNVALIQSALGHKDLKTTLGVYARVNKTAELQAKQTAHAVWFKAAESPPEEKITDIQDKRQSRA